MCVCTVYVHVSQTLICVWVCVCVHACVWPLYYRLGQALPSPPLCAYLLDNHKAYRIKHNKIQICNKTWKSGLRNYSRLSTMFIKYKNKHEKINLWQDIQFCNNSALANCGCRDLFILWSSEKRYQSIISWSFTVRG